MEKLIVQNSLVRKCNCFVAMPFTLLLSRVDFCGLLSNFGNYLFSVLTAPEYYQSVYKQFYYFSLAYSGKKWTENDYCNCL